MLNCIFGRLGSVVLLCAFLLVSCSAPSFNEFNEKQFSEIVSKEIFDGKTDLNILDSGEFKQEYNYLYHLIHRISGHAYFANEDSAKWKIIIAKDNDVLNVMALPGGVLILFTGTIQKSKTPFDLILVLSHCMTHIQEGHCYDNLKKEYGSGLLISVSNRSNLQSIPNIIQSLTMINYDKKQEFMSDSISLQILRFLGGSVGDFNDYFRSQTDEGLEEDFPNFIVNHGNNRYRTQIQKNNNPNRSMAMDIAELEPFLKFKSRFR